MSLLACTLSVVAHAALGGGVVYHDSSFELDGRLLDHRFLALDEGAAQTLVLAVGLGEGRRELRFHPLGARGFSAEPERTIEVLEDVVAYGLADVRDEPGRELLFLTRTGAWSYSLRHEGYRDNIRRLVELELIYDVPDPRELPFWEYVLPATAGDLVILPGRDGFVLCTPRAESAEASVAAYVSSTPFTTDAVAAKPVVALPAEESSTTVTIGSGGVMAFTSTSAGLLMGEDTRTGSGLLSSDVSYRAPALADVNGDGRADLILLEVLRPTGDEADADDATRRRLRVHLGSRDGLAREPDRIEELPPYLVGDSQFELELLDLDGDGDLDLLARTEQEGDGFADSEHRVLVLINDGERLLPAEPSQVLRFEAAGLTMGVCDADNDGRFDLVIRKFEMPSLLQAVTGLEFRMTHLLYLGEDGRRPFARKPALKQEESFDETSVAEMIANRHLKLDCDGDGRPDLVEIDLQGRIAIRRLAIEKSFFGGKRWVLDESPWQRFDARGSIESLTVADINGDGLGDIVSAGARSLSILLSRRAR